MKALKIMLLVLASSYQNLYSSEQPRSVSPSKKTAPKSPAKSEKPFSEMTEAEKEQVRKDQAARRRSVSLKKAQEERDPYTTLNQKRKNLQNEEEITRIGFREDRLRERREIADDRWWDRLRQMPNDDEDFVDDYSVATGISEEWEQDEHKKPILKRQSSSLQSLHELEETKVFQGSAVACSKQEINAVVKVQAGWKTYKAKKLLRKLKQENQELLEKQGYAATKIQAIWKGYEVRRRCLSQELNSNLCHTSDRDDADTDKRLLKKTDKKIIHQIDNIPPISCAIEKHETQWWYIAVLLAAIVGYQWGTNIHAMLKTYMQKMKTYVLQQLTYCGCFLRKKHNKKAKKIILQQDYIVVPQKHGIRLSVHYETHEKQKEKVMVVSQGIEQKNYVPQLHADVAICEDQITDTVLKDEGISIVDELVQTLEKDPKSYAFDEFVKQHKALGFGTQFVTLMLQYGFGIYDVETCTVLLPEQKSELIRVFLQVNSMPDIWNKKNQKHR